MTEQICFDGTVRDDKGNETYAMLVFGKDDNTGEPYAALTIDNVTTMVPFANFLLLLKQFEAVAKAARDQGLIE
ncbi:Uncharacterised protein [uncultured archaeon]|nr:Uncharacterised protein [uncultured archaeon]